jgi:sodium/hydrogen antiporter
MNTPSHFILMTAGGLILFTSLFIKRIHRSFLSEPVLVMLIGLMINLTEIRGFQMNDTHSLMNVFTRVTIIVALIATALRVKHSFIVTQKKNLLLMIPLAMLGMWLLSSMLFYLVIKQDFLFSLLVGAIITPTDPVVATSMLTGELAKKLLPERIRSALSFESASNDGLTFLMVMLSFLLIIYPTNFALEEFFLKILVWENLAAIFLAGLLGYFLGRVFHYFHKKKKMDEQAVIGFALSLTFFIYGLFEILKTNSIISVFAAGFAFNSVISKSEAVKEESIQEVIERMLVVPIFFLFGLIVPWRDWLEMGWILVLFAILVLLFRRLPVFILLKPFLKGYNIKDILLMGWFGPVGVAALFYALYINEKQHFNSLWELVSFVVFASTVVHGFTRYVVSKKYHEYSDKSVN